MLLITIIAGIVTGWIINLLSDYLPQFSVNKEKRYTTRSSHMPATVEAIMRVFNQNKVRQQQWFWLHLGIEVISAIVFALLMLVYGVDSQGIVIGGVYIYFMIIAVIDVKYRLVLNVMMYPAMLFVLFVPIAQPQPSTLELSLGGILVFCIFGLTAWLKPGQIGGGDIKLAILIGFMFGFPQVLWALLVGGGTGAVVAIAMLSTGRYGRKSTIPYAPFLCLGAMIALIYNPILF